jgi:hypothetical protein
MPGYKFHILFGIVFAGILSYIFYRLNILQAPTWTVLLIVPILFVYCILPDIDAAGSLIRRIVTVIGLGAIIATAYLKITMITIAVACILFLLQFTEHRKFFHTVVAALLFSLPLYLIHPSVAIFGFIGYMSHLVIDGKVTVI